MFSWSSDEGTSVADVKAETDSAPQVPDMIHICTELSGDRSKPFPLETIKPADSAGAVGDSSPRTDIQSLPKDTALGSPRVALISQPKLQNVDTPYVREEQQVFLPSLSPVPHHSPVPQESSGPPVVPNSATSIFAFKFPMFAKSPPETAVAPPPRDPSVEPSCEPPIATPGTDVPVILLPTLGFITVDRSWKCTCDGCG